MPFAEIIERYRGALTARDQGDRFEELIKRYLETAPLYAHEIETVWMWREFPYKDQFSGKDTGIDLVAKKADGGYIAIQCKCYGAEKEISKKDVDTFLSTSGKSFFADGEADHLDRKLRLDTEYAEMA